MRILIDIPEDSYERVMNPDKFYRDIDGEKIRWAVYKGIPIPDNATNGDIIKAFYPELVVGSNNLGKTIFLRPNATVVIEDRMSEWWNAPYQKGGK